VNRLGFFLLTLGSILAYLGWRYEQDLIAIEGFFLLVALCGLGSAWPTAISYKPEVEVQPMGTAARRLWGLYYAFALLLAVVGFAHTQAGGHGEWLVVAGFVLFGALVLYDAFQLERFRAWRLERLRSLRGAMGR